MTLLIMSYVVILRNLVKVFKRIKNYRSDFFHLVLKKPIYLILFTVAFINIMNFTQNQIKYVKYKFSMANQMEQMINKIPAKYRTYTVKLCTEKNIPIYIISRVIHIESRWNPYAVGRVNYNGTRDYGLGQLNSRYLGLFVKWFYKGKEKFNVYNWKHNLQVATGFLKSLNKMFKGNWYRTICAYNAGPNAVRYGMIPSSTYAYADRILSPIRL